MVSRILALAPLAIGATVLIGLPASAQQREAASPKSLPSLSERLEQFRQDLIGVPVQTPKRAEADRRASQPVRKAPAARAGQGVQQPAGPQQPQAGPQRPGSTQPPRGAPAVRKPRRLEVQSARKAQPSRGLIPTTTPPERGVPDEQQAAGPRVDIDELADGTRAPRDQRKASPATPQRDVPTLARRPVRDDLEPPPDTTLFTTRSPVLSVVAMGPRTVRVGARAECTIKIRNSGAAASNVVVTVNVPAHTEVASAHATAGTVPGAAAGEAGGPLEWKIPRLEGNSIETLNLALVPHKSEPMDLAVQFTYAPESSQLIVEVQEPKLEMAISGPDDLLFGETRIFKLTLSNPGNGDADNVVIGLLPVGPGAEGISSHRLGTLRAGQSKTIDVELTARQAGTITIKAQAHADGGLRSEAAEQVLVRRASLQVEIEAPRVTFAGTHATYRVKVVNSGNAPADDVSVTAMLPPDAKFIASSAGGRFDSQQGKVNWSAGNLAPGAQRSFDMQCALGTPGDNRMQFVATAAGDVSTSATSNTQVEALADLKIELRDPQGPIAVDTDALYEVVLRNRGSAAAKNIELVVFFSEGLEAHSVDGPEHEIATGQVLFQPIAAIGAGDVLVIKVHAKANRSGHHVFRAELFCESLGTKLAAEEATYFYGDEVLAPADQTEVDELEPTPAVESEQQPQQPTPVAPRALPQDDEPPAVPE